MSSLSWRGCLLEDGGGSFKFVVGWRIVCCLSFLGSWRVVLQEFGVGRGRGVGWEKVVWV